MLRAESATSAVVQLLNFMPPDIGSDLSSASVSPVVCSIFELLSYWINEMKDLGLLRRCRPPDSRFSAAGSASDLLVIGRS